MTHQNRVTQLDNERMLEAVRQLFERYRRAAAERERRFERREAETGDPDSKSVSERSDRRG